VCCIFAVPPIVEFTTPTYTPHGTSFVSHIQLYRIEVSVRAVSFMVACRYLHCSRKHILRLSRHGVIPAHPISFGRRVTWRYLLSELHAWVLGNRAPVNVAENGTSARRMADGSPRKGGR